MPWVELSVGENDVGSLEEVALGDASSKVIKSPVVLRKLTVEGLAVGRVLLLVPGCRGEHRGGCIGGEWHHHLVAG